MLSPIRHVAVLGAGTMGSGIAAHCANAGIPVVLLDIVAPDTKPGAPKSARDKLAAGGLAKLAKQKPPAFMHARNAALVTVGNLDDDLAQAGACDLVIEAIVERLDIKQKLFEKLEKVLGPRTIVASNTSGLRIADMLAGRSEQFRKHFLVTHFFNPPRYMKLLELVAGPETRREALQRVETFGREVLGKGIVWAKDTPNFIGNRIGLHSMMTTIHLMLERGLAPEDVDAITGLPMGHPKSATFRTADVVGLDTVGHVAANCYKALDDDEERPTFAAPAYITKLIEQQRLGDKTGGGFYKKVGADIQTLDPATGEYRPKGGDRDIAKAMKGIGDSDPRVRVAKLVANDGPAGKFAWTVLSRSLAYAARRIPEITDSVEAIDNAMKWGYGWELGPFETWDALGFAATYDRMKADGIALPAWVDKMRTSGAAGFYSGTDRAWDPQRGDLVARQLDPREATWDIMKRGDAPVLSNKGAECRDLGDGILGLTFKSPYNAINADVIQMLHDGVARAEQDFRAMVIWNRGEHFCVGADLMSLAGAIGQKDWAGIRTMVSGYQAATQRMKYAQVPVVAAPWYATMGGGLELCLGSTAVQAFTETVSGLVEVGVGLIPGGAGTMNLLWRALEGVPEGTEIDTYAYVTQVFKNIALGKLANSAEEGKSLGYFRATDGVSFDRARQLHEACRRAKGLADAGHHAPIPRAYKLPGESGIATLQMLVNTLVAAKYATAHDGTIAMKLARVLCGGSSGATHAVTEQEMLELECEAFLSLCGEPLSQARIQHFLMTQKPLRN